LGSDGDRLVTLDGSTFFVTDRRGDALGIDTQGTRADGFFFSDVRHLSTWQLLVDGAPIRVLTARSVDYYSARVYATTASARVGVNPTVSVRRDRIVADGVHEDVVVDNHSDEARRIRVELCYAADFADLFEVKDATPPKGRHGATVDGSDVVLWVERDGQRRATRLSFSVAGDLGAGRAAFDVQLGPRQRWEICIDVSCAVGDAETGPRCRHGGFGKLQPQMPMTLA
jgi:hypothetical protein